MVRVEDVPLTLMLVLDVSQSVQGEPLAQLRAAIDASASALSAADRLALFTFSHHVAAAAGPHETLPTCGQPHSGSKRAVPPRFTTPRSPP